MEASSAHLITGHDLQGTTIFTDVVPESSHKIKMPFGTLEYLYSNPAILPDMNHAEDLDQTKHSRINGLPNGRVTNDNGLAVSLVTFKPGSSSPLHRTRSLDLGIVLEGEVELELDSGIKRVLKTGDTIVQRGTAHMWRNISPGEGWLRMYFVAIDARPIVVDGEELPEEWGLSGRSLG